MNSKYHTSSMIKILLANLNKLLYLSHRFRKNALRLLNCDFQLKVHITFRNL